MDIEELLSKDESEFLDFKAEFHADNLDLLHDILCLANSYSNQDRYLVFGVKNSPRSVCGIESDPNKKTNADLHDFLRQSLLNRVPTVELRILNHHSGHKLAVLIIFNRPDKPFFVTKDRRSGQSVLRAGVVYTRLGDTNVPKNETAPEDHIELMWRERFGIGVDPLTRFIRLLEDVENWVHVKGDEYIYHQQFPEFVIKTGDTLVEDFREPWSRRFPDPYARSYYVDLVYLNTVLMKALFVSCDGGRYQIPAPEYNEDETWSLNTASIEYKIAKIFWQYYPLEDALRIAHVSLI